jgi:F-type H+-transporting ATPase subunit epsilon
VADFKLDVVTPEKSIAKDISVESVILPGELGQLNALPLHVDLMTTLAMGSFAYRTAGEWKWAFLSGGFAQIKNGRITVLAETMDLAHEIDLAQAQLAVQTASENLKKSNISSPEYSDLARKKLHADARLEAAKKHI